MAVKLKRHRKLLVLFGIEIFNYEPKCHKQMVDRLTFTCDLLTAKVLSLPQSTGRHFKTVCHPFVSYGVFIPGHCEL